MRPRLFQVSIPLSSGDMYLNKNVIAENGLSFIETSALDASNVEAAFQTILTGNVSFSL
jgi:hypothetical protein